MQKLALPKEAHWAFLHGSLGAANGQERELQGISTVRLWSHTAIRLRSIGCNKSQDRIRLTRERENHSTLRRRVAKSLYREAYAFRIGRN